MNDFNMYLLYPIRKAMVWRADFYIGKTRQLPAVLASECNDLHAALLGGFSGFDDVGGLAAGTDGQEHISFIAQRFEIPRKNLIVSVVIPYARDVRSVGNADSRNGLAGFTVFAGKLFSKVHGVAVRAAVAA